MKGVGLVWGSPSPSVEAVLFASSEECLNEKSPPTETYIFSDIWKFRMRVCTENMTSQFAVSKMYYFSFLFRINSMPLSTGELWPPRVTPRVWSCKRYTYLVFPQWASAFLKINPFYHPFYHPTHPDSYCWLCSAISFQLTMKFSSAEPLQLNGDSCVSRKWSRWPSFPSPVIARIQCSRQSAQHYERTELLYL